MQLNRSHKITRYIVDYTSKDNPGSQIFVRCYYDTYAQYLDDKRRNFPSRDYTETILVWEWDALSQCWHYSELEMED